MASVPPLAGNKKNRIAPVLLLEATMGFEPMMRVLQTLALPLGDVAITLPVKRGIKNLLIGD